MTRLLARLRSGDQSAMGELLDIAYSELRGMAGNLFRDQPADHTLQPTALVNEVAARLLKAGQAGGNMDWNDRKHFFCVAARAMRNLLTDHARARGAERRGGDGAGRRGVKVSLDTLELPAVSSEIDLVVLDETLTRLAKLDERLGRIFELRFLVGLSVEKTAEIVEVSPRTVEMDTRFIRAWLQKELTT
ncbi:MAG: ECF-type sigma factor [Planctomycetota bacterium]